MGNIGRDFKAHTVSGIPRFIEIFTLLFTQRLMHRLFLTIITTYRLAEGAGNQPEIAIDLHILL